MEKLEPKRQSSDETSEDEEQMETRRSLDMAEGQMEHGRAEDGEDGGGNP